MALFAKVVSFPPLQQMTVVPARDDPIRFTVLIEASLVFPPLPWEVTVYHRKDVMATWEELPLSCSTRTPLLLTRDPIEECRTKSRYRHVYTGALWNTASKSNKISFQVRYRLDSYSPWYWVMNGPSAAVGEIISQCILPHLASPLSNFVELQPTLGVSALDPHENGSLCYRLEIPVGPWADQKNDFKVHIAEIGSVLNQERYFALVQITEPWTAPRHGRTIFDLQEDATLCCFLSIDGLCITLLGLSGLGATQVALKSDHNGNIVAVIRNNMPAPSIAQVICSVATTVDDSIAAVMDIARETFAKQGHSSVLLPKGLAQLGRTQSSFADAQYHLEDWYDGLAYCTWNSLGWDINVDKILTGLSSLQANGINVSTLIIDDNWQSIDDSDRAKPRMHQAMQRFEANSSFPDGLADATAKIRMAHPHLKDIAVWHALLGYWGGIAPDGEIAKEYQTTVVEAQLWRHAMRTISAVDPEDIHRFYDDFYAFLASSGVTAVKTDVQFMLGELASGERRAAFLDSYCSAWTAAHLTHFQGRAISCMSMTPQTMFRSFLPQDVPKVLLRNSDDFFPEVPISHPLHIFNNAHNALMVEHLNVIGDWDMFQTSHPYSAFHAAARCLSGGPIYITDCPGEHDVKLIQQMSATSPCGRTIALRPDVGAKTISAWDDFSSHALLRMRAHCGLNGQKRTTLLGIFNMDDKDYTCLLSQDDLLSHTQASSSGSETPDRLLRSWQDDRYFAQSLTNSKPQDDSLLYADIPVRSFDIIYAHPIEKVLLERCQISFAVLGLLGKMAGPAAVLDWRVATDKQGLKLQVDLKALGSLGIWFAGDNFPVEEGRFSVGMCGHRPESDCVLTAVENGGFVLEIDVLGLNGLIKPDSAGQGRVATVEIDVRL